MNPSIHPDLHPISFLLGTWVGTGSGIYPTIDDFFYDETATYTHVGKPFIAYGQKTRRSDSGEPLHSEAGYFRPSGVSAVELLIAQPSGISELHVGEVSGSTIDLTATSVVTTPTAKEVVSVRRLLMVEGDSMRYQLFMGAVGQPHQLHLSATLKKVKPA
ncbi:MAG: FABP family protein [Acidimicrobiia bacterium]|nr:FABP family protein [Acidimicrobiia bacterium]